MSVVEPARRGNRLLVHVRAQELAAYTSEILQNPKKFDPEIDPELLKRIKDCSMEIYEYLWAANRWRADGNIRERMKRRDLQEEGISICDRMEADIGIAKKVFHIRMKRMKHWNGRIEEVRKLAVKWKESDISRFGDIYAAA